MKMKEKTRINMKERMKEKIDIVTDWEIEEAWGTKDGLLPLAWGTKEGLQRKTPL